MTAAPRRPARRRATSGRKRAAIAKPKRARAAGRKRAPAAKPKRTRAASRKRGSRRPALRVVPRRGPKPSRSFPQRDGASDKQSVLFELMRARAALGAAIQGLTGGSAAEPIAPGKWNVRQIVLHVGHWDREAVRAIEGALRDRRPEWLGWGAANDAVANRAALASLEHHDWDGAVRLLHAIRAEFLEAIESIPDEPAEVWSRAHAFGEMLWSAAEHDRHHAEAIKRWRTGRAK